MTPSLAHAVSAVSAVSAVTSHVDSMICCSTRSEKFLVYGDGVDEVRVQKSEIKLRQPRIKLLCITPNIFKTTFLKFDTPRYLLKFVLLNDPGCCKAKDMHETVVQEQKLFESSRRGRPWAEACKI